MSTIGAIQEYLKSIPPETIVNTKFHNPHSYRGYYSELSLEEEEGMMTAKELFELLESAKGPVFIGWKGGDFTYGDFNDVYVAEKGCCGDELSVRLLKELTKEGASHE